MRIIDRNNPPSKPREIKGKAAINTFWDDICSRAITHKVETSIAEGSRIAFTQACAYPDGAKVFSQAMLDLKAPAGRDAALCTITVPRAEPADQGAEPASAASGAGFAQPPAWPGSQNRMSVPPPGAASARTVPP